jgi:hypothetical protein
VISAGAPTPDVASNKPEITPPSNSNHLRDSTVAGKLLRRLDIPDIPYRYFLQKWYGNPDPKNWSCKGQRYPSTSTPVAGPNDH